MPRCSIPMGLFIYNTINHRFIQTEDLRASFQDIWIFFCATRPPYKENTRSENWPDLSPVFLDMLSDPMLNCWEETTSELKLPIHIFPN
ncbi:hypothetical protein PR048_000475, partial [Dryococelus australis]